MLTRLALSTTAVTRQEEMMAMIGEIFQYEEMGWRAPNASHGPTYAWDRWMGREHFIDPFEFELGKAVPELDLADYEMVRDQLDQARAWAFS